MNVPQCAVFQVTSELPSSSQYCILRAPLRPFPGFQIAWDADLMAKMLKTIYRYRSMALQGGTPFPAPMCDEAFLFTDDKVYSERGTLGLAASEKWGVWRAKDLSMELHSFHYAVHRLALNWWSFLLKGSNPDRKLLQEPQA